MPNSTNVSTGNAGEYFAAGELERHGFTLMIRRYILWQVNNRKKNREID